ncbi:spheroidene monooxygenase [Rhodobacter sp. Har01]|uniref:spheroidene monooxygenase n=1 Tax=Rhodobacter sp. Har01 TaxID=2883999 RepID=UPI0029CA6193|nr:spheroidene monooxygenase [Rhodobacter sp. Har01]
MPVASLSLFRIKGAQNRLWMIGQMAMARFALRKEDDLQFFKLCGSGTGEGFTPRPNWDVWGIWAVWPDEATARARTEKGTVWRRWRSRTIESGDLFLSPIASRGSWGRVNPFTPMPDTGKGPMVALTRAQIKLKHFNSFWSREPEISRRIGADPNVMFKIGLGEMPLLFQSTFSVWPDTTTMSNFARGNTVHGQAIKSVRDERWFVEELYARFRLLGATGSWGGKSLASLLTPAKPGVSPKAAALSAERASVGARERAKARSHY